MNADAWAAAGATAAVLDAQIAARAASRLNGAVPGAPIAPVEWPRLDALSESDDHTPAAFPFDALGSILGAAASAIARDVQAPDALAGGSVLAHASLAAQSLVDVVLPHGQQVPTSLYVVSASESGDRKSVVDAVAGHEVGEMRRKQARDHAELVQMYDQAMAERKPKDPLPDKPPAQSLITSNATTEGLLRILKGQSLVGVFSPEGGEILNGYSMRDDRRAGALPFFLKLWSGETLDALRGGDGLTMLLGRRLAMHVMVQPILLRQLLADPLAKGQGLLARCLIAQPRTLAGSRLFNEKNPHQDKAVIAYHAAIKLLLESRPQVWDSGDGLELKPTPLTMSDPARGLWVAFYNKVECQQADGCELENARAFASKTAEHAARIAGVITMTKDDKARSISSITMEGAIEVATFYLNEHLRLTSTGRAKRQQSALRALLTWMQGHGAQFPKKDVLQKLEPHSMRKLKAAGINPLLEELVQRGYIRERGSTWEVRQDVQA
ncbi:MAG: DUF3987 domain-containing protein [Burkholderiales bacterium]|nr:MAG: DUF3987 domain-containing protein [Burkholderiales bacterium]